MRERLRWSSLLVASLLLSACSTVTPPRPSGLPGDALSGRMTVRIEPVGSPAAARAVSAVFELTGDAQHGTLALSTPLGTLMAQAQWQPGSVTLATPQGQSRHADLAALTRAALGEELPVAALFDWLRGRPWPDAPSVPRPSSATADDSASDAPASFRQLGWDVDLAGFTDALVVARRPQEPPITVRVKLDRP